MNKKQVYSHLNIIRIFACFLVILIHSPLPIANQISPSIWVSIYNYLSAPCIGLFFILTGYLLLPTEESLSNFANKRLPKILYLLLFWTLFYITSKYLNGTVSFEQSIKTLLCTVFLPAEGILWYLYTLIPTYLFISIISPWLKKCTKKELLFFLILWILSLCLPYLYSFTNIKHPIPGDYFNIVNTFGGYLGYLILGYFLKTYPIKLNLKIVSTLFFFLTMISGVLPSLYYLNILTNIPNRDLYSYLIINVALLSFAYFVILSSLPTPSSQTINNSIQLIANYTFGIYLLHTFLLRPYIWNIITQLDIKQHSFSIPLTVLITFIVSSLCVKLIAHLPFKKYIIG